MESLESLWECDDSLPDFDDADDHLQPAPASPALAQPSPQDLLEDGEIVENVQCQVRSTIIQSDHREVDDTHRDCSFQFMGNDLDTAILSSKKLKKSKKAAKMKGKSRKKSDHKKAQEIDLKAFIARTSRFLKEPKHYLVEAAVERLGIDVVRDLVHEVETIEKNGGQMIANGMRRRTPGGVLWNVLRSRYKEDYTAIMATGRSFEKKQRQEKRKMEVNDMTIDGGQPSTKRRRTGETGPASMASAQAAQVKRTGVIVWPARRMQMDDIHSKVDPDNSRTLSRVQNAWADGVKNGKPIAEDMKKGKHVVGLSDVEMLDDAVNKKSTRIVERLRIPIQYDDL